MGYADKNLAPGETILYRARYHWIIYRFTIVLLVLAARAGCRGALREKVRRPETRSASRSLTSPRPSS